MSVILAVGAAWALALAGSAQDPQAPLTVQVAQPSVLINYRERPRLPFDPQRLKLRPNLDGEIGATEWSPLYTVSEGAVTGTVYLNWDDDFLYVAAKMDQAGWLVADIDASGDGWLRGADNLELVVAPVTEAAAAPLTARVLDASVNRDAPVWNEAVVDPRSVPLVVKQSGPGQVVEMAVPRGLAGLAPRAGALVGFRADFLPAGTAPVATAPYEPHLLLDVTLVESKTVAVTGIIPRLSLEDNSLVPGQTLHATLDLHNQIDEARGVRSVTWTGVGPAESYLKTVREVAVPDVKGLKTLRLRYSSPLPDKTVPGFYQFSVTAEMDDGSKVSATSSFSVEEAFTIALEAEPTDLALIGPTQVRLTVTLTSAAPGFKRTDVTIEAPASWEIKGRAKRSVNVHRENGTARTVFVATIPSATQTGEYRIGAEVTWRGKTWTTHRIVKVTRVEQGR